MFGTSHIEVITESVFFFFKLNCLLLGKDKDMVSISCSTVSGELFTMPEGDTYLAVNISTCGFVQLLNTW